VVPLTLLLVLAVGVILVANIAAILPAHRARRLSTADLLRDD
jgi:ABC-type lipoprotein release transport system permease subunit